MYLNILKFILYYSPYLSIHQMISNLYLLQYFSMYYSTLKIKFSNLISMNNSIFQFHDDKLAQNHEKGSTLQLINSRKHHDRIE